MKDRTAIQKEPYNDSEMLIFYNEFFDARIRSVSIDGEAWFVAKDVAIALGFSDIKKAIRYHVDDEDILEVDEMGRNKSHPIPKRKDVISDGVVRFPYVVDILGRIQRPIWINESGVNALILGRNNMRNRHLGPNNTGPTVKEFRKWITGTVLPKIRKRGIDHAEKSRVDELERRVADLEEQITRMSYGGDGFFHLIRRR